MKFGVIIFPGSNSDHDMIYALEHVYKQEVVELWHKDTDLQGVDMIMIPGGFSYGDYLRSGAIASLSPIMTSVKDFAAQGGPVLGVCNGFQILCEAGLLPGTLQHNESRKFISENVVLKVEQNTSFATNQQRIGDLISIPVAHGEGNYYINQQGLTELQENNQILFTYSNTDGEVSDQTNINGSVNNIAGIANKEGNVIGLMPHPERAVDIELLHTDGATFFDSILASFNH